MSASEVDSLRAVGFAISVTVPMVFALLVADARWAVQIGTFAGILQLLMECARYQPTSGEITHE